MTIKLYNTKEAAEVLRISTRTLRKYVDDGKIEALRIGRGWRFTEKGINDFISKAGNKQKKG